jgi:uncharacterized phage protein gp47/JayE
MAYDYISNNGVIIVDTSSTRSEVEQEFKTAFEDDTLVTTSDTPQGILINAITLERDEIARNNANLANQINPNIAGGIFLDAIMSMTGLSRNTATSTTVTATVTGANGTVIPAGTKAKTGADDEFESTSIITIPISGSITVPFQSVEKGAIPCAISSLTQIVDPILGWETITNLSAGILGSATQSDSSSRKLRKNTLALQAVGVPTSIISSVSAVSGVTSLQFRENVESTTEVIDGQTLVPHSIWMCVDGGTDEDVGEAIILKKSLGCNYNGDVIVNVTEPSSGQVYPVKFYRPILIPCKMEITVKLTGGASDPTTTIKNSIINWANGLTEEEGLTVGTDFTLYEATANIAQQTGYFVVDAQNAKIADPLDRNKIDIAINEKATITESSITVIFV